MSGASVALLAVSLGVLTATFQQLLARTHLLELALSSGTGTTTPTRVTGPTQQRLSHDSVDEDRARAVLPPDAITVIVTSTCSACRRLVADLADPTLRTSHDIHLWFDKDSFGDERGWANTVVASSEDQMAARIDSLGLSLFPHVVLTTGSDLPHAPVSDLDALTRFVTSHGVRLGDHDAPSELTRP